MPLWPLEVTEYYARKYTGSVGCGWVLPSGDVLIYLGWFGMRLMMMGPENVLLGGS